MALVKEPSLALKAGRVFDVGMFRIFLAALLLTSPLHSVTIPYTEAGKHVGEEVTVTGKVSGVRVIASGMGFVNFGGRAFTAVARPGIFEAGKLEEYDGKDVEVTGAVELYNGSPQIVLKSPEAIRLAGAAPAAIPADPQEKDTSAPATSPAAFEIEALDVPMEKKDVRLAGKSPSGFVPKAAKVVIASPRDFKPASPQRILVLVPDFVSESDLEKLVVRHATVAAPKGWLTLTAHCPTPDEFPTSGLYAASIQAALRHLSEQHQGAGEWPLYLVGNSMGAGRATLASGALLKEGFDVRGCFLSSLKREEFGKSIREFRPSQSRVRRMVFFVSHGERDSFVTKGQSLGEAEAIRETGAKEVRHEIHSGRGGLDEGSLVTALDWFGAQE